MTVSKRKGACPRGTPPPSSLLAHYWSGASTARFAAAVVVILPLLQLLPLLAVGWLVGLAFRDLRRARKHRRPPPYNILPGILKDEAPADEADREGHNRWYHRRRRGQHRRLDAPAALVSDGGRSSGDPLEGATPTPAAVIGRGLPHRLSSITGNATMIRTPSQAKVKERRLSLWSGGSDEGRESRKSRGSGMQGRRSTVGKARDSVCNVSSIVVDETPERPSRPHDRHKHLCSLAAESSQPVATPSGVAVTLAESSAKATAVMTAARMRSVSRGMSCRDLGLAAAAPTAPVEEERPPATLPQKACSRWRGATTSSSSSLVVPIAPDGARALQMPATLERMPTCAKCRPATGWALPPPEMPPGWNTARTKLAAVNAFQGGLRAKTPAPAASEAGGSVSKVVELVRTPLGLGLSLDSQNRVVSIAAGSQAERCGGFDVHDRLLSLDGRPLRRGAFKEQLGAIAMGTKVRIEIASLQGPSAGSGRAPAGGSGARPDAEIVRRALAEHGARVKAEALAEAKVEASEIKAEAASVLANATAQARRTESASQQAREAAQLALGAVASIAASAQRSVVSPTPLGRAAVRRVNSADRRVRPMPDTPYAMTVDLSPGSISVRRPSAPSQDAAASCSDGEDSYDTGVYTV